MSWTKPEAFFNINLCLQFARLSIVNMAFNVGPTVKDVTIGIIRNDTCDDIKIQTS